MSDKSAIEWTDATWNPVTGCSKVSPGCAHCYAETFAERWRGTKGHHFEQGFDLKLWPDRLEIPLKWKEPRRIFVNSMSDLFHEDIPIDFIAKVFAVMAACQRHTFQILTKRAERMAAVMIDPAFLGTFDSTVRVNQLRGLLPETPEGSDPWPLSNVWLGVSVENQRAADERIPLLLRTPAAVRFLSCEPLLGPIDLSKVRPTHKNPVRADQLGHIAWVICGGESGHKARPMHPEWARSLRDQCQALGAPFFFKQWGVWAPETVCATERGAESALYLEIDGKTRPAARGARGQAITIQKNGKKLNGRLLDGKEWNQFPGADL